MSRPFTSAVILAAGSSVRMGGSEPKQFIPLLNKPALSYTLRSFEECDLIDEMILVTRADHISRATEISKSFSKVSRVIPGGEDRFESSRLGVNAASDKTDYIAIHDGARSLITKEEIHKVVLSAYDNKAATLAVPLTDTVKVVSADRRVVSTPDRSTLFAVQTPQVFEKALYLEAAKFAVENKLAVTDDCSLVEAIGRDVYIVEGCYTNIKLTTPSDILVAEAILKERGK